MTAELAPLRPMSPYAIVNRKASIRSAGDGKVYDVWAVHRRPGMVWLAANNHGIPAHVDDLDIVVASPHLCTGDPLCCDDCLTHLGCRCPEPVEDVDAS